MPAKNGHTPKRYDGVMVSSTFDDLQQHRKILAGALHKQELLAINMENYVVNPDDDVIGSSLTMVEKSSAYIGLISHRYGEPPLCDVRNPNGYSASRLEFEKAQTLNLPTLIFIMSKDHLCKPSYIESDPQRQIQLKEYREQAKEGRIYVMFDNIEDFTSKAIHAVAKLCNYLDEQAKLASTPEPITEAIATPIDETKTTQSNIPLIPCPPAFYAAPRYIGSHQFVGRKAQLDIIDDWASPADPHSILLFEAIGGTGKSMLTWQWVEQHAMNCRTDWAGRFWYSFYEKGAVMTDFCCRALAYMTEKPLEDYQKMNMHQLTQLLLPQLQAKPWLIVLDGLERILVAYHRLDAAQLSDEEAGLSDEISERDPCKAIRPQDDELLRYLAAVTPSKILISSRLIPQVLLNQARQSIPGVLRERLAGLRPVDAEALFRACGITGSSDKIQNFLRQHCDCHPLVIGALAGLVNDYLPNRGHFDDWQTAPSGGGNLNLAELDLVQKRNHILTAAMAALDDKSHQLLSTLALLSEAIDFNTLSAFNPYLPPAPDDIDNPQADTLQQLQAIISNLEKRGLLQYDHQSKSYDLHPVVRVIAAGALQQADKERFGTLVVDHFSNQSHNPYDEAETLADVSHGLHIVRTFIQMGQLEKAFDAFEGDLNHALMTNLSAHVENLAILRAFFPNGWHKPANIVSKSNKATLFNLVAFELANIGEFSSALSVFNAAIIFATKNELWWIIGNLLGNLSSSLFFLNKLSSLNRCLLSALAVSAETDDHQDLFDSRNRLYSQFIITGQWQQAESLWPLFYPLCAQQPRGMYRLGGAERDYGHFLFYQNKLTHTYLVQTEQLANEGRDRNIIKEVHQLRGHWHLSQKQYRKRLMKHRYSHRRPAAA